LRYERSSVSCATNEAVFQISDRRLTEFGDPTRARPEEANKAVFWGGRVYFAYTGRLDSLSLSSLYLKLLVNGNELGTATGFVVAHSGRRFLITNWHVLSGRNPETGKPCSATGGLSDEVRIAHHLKGKLECRFIEIAGGRGSGFISEGSQPTSKKKTANPNSQGTAGSGTLTTERVHV